MLKGELSFCTQKTRILRYAGTETSPPLTPPPPQILQLALLHTIQGFLVLIHSFSLIENGILGEGDEM